MFSHNNTVFFIIGLSLLLLPVSPGLAQNGISTPDTGIFISAQTLEEANTITLDCLVRQNGQVVAGLQPENFTVSEAAVSGLDIQELPVATSVATAIIVDLSVGSDITYIRDTLMAYVNTTYQQGDTIIMLVNDGPAYPRRISISSRGNFIEAIQELRAGGDSYSIVDGLERALPELQSIQQNQPLTATQALVVGTYLYAEGRAASQAFGAAGIPLHAVQAHDTRSGSTGDFRALASNGGGIFVENLHGGLSTGQTAIGELATLYNRINDYHRGYRLTYSSASTDLTPIRTVTVNAVLSDGTILSTLFEYETAFLPPIVEIVAPTNINPTRHMVDTDGNFDISEEILTIEVIYPDHIPRPLKEARLEVTDLNTGSAAQAINIIDSPVLDANNQFTLTWDLSSYPEPEETYQVGLLITITDELDMITTSSTEGMVVVSPVLKEPTFTPVPTYTGVPTFTPPPTFTPQSSIIAKQVGAEDVGQKFDLLIIGVLLSIVVLLLAVILFLTRTRRGKAISASVMSTVTQTYRSMTEVLGVGGTHVIDDAVDNQEEAPPSQGRAFARLLIRYGWDAGQPIEIDRSVVIIGREIAAGCTRAIPQRFVSSRHFSIRRDKDTSNDYKFIIEDLGSANGTVVNGHRLQSGEKYQLFDGAIITIANRLELVFETEHTGDATQIQRTSVVGQATASEYNTIAPVNDEETLDDIFAQPPSSSSSPPIHHQQPPPYNTQPPHQSSPSRGQQREVDEDWDKKLDL